MASIDDFDEDNEIVTAELGNLWTEDTPNIDPLPHFNFDPLPHIYLDPVAHRNFGVENQFLIRQIIN